MKTSLGVLLPLGVALLSAPARAQGDSDEEPWQRRAHIDITPQRQGFSFQILPGGGTRAIAECKTHCEFWVPLGRYVVRVRDLESGERTELRLRIKGSASFSYEEEDPTLHDVGMVLGLFGSLSAVVGAVVLLSNIDTGESPMHQSSSTSLNTGAAVGGLMFLGGAIAAPVGFVMAARSGAALRPISAESSANRHAPSFRFGLVGVNGGLGLGGGAVF